MSNTKCHLKFCCTNGGEFHSIFTFEALPRNPGSNTDIVNCLNMVVLCFCDLFNVSVWLCDVSVFYVCSPKHFPASYIKTATILMISNFLLRIRKIQHIYPEGKNQNQISQILTVPDEGLCQIKLLGAICTVCRSFIRFLPSVLFLIQHLYKFFGCAYPTFCISIH